MPSGRGTGEEVWSRPVSAAASADDALGQVTESLWGNCSLLWVGEQQ